MEQYEIDLRGLLCPLPVIKTQTKVRQCQNGDLLKIIATDPNVKQDIPSWCRINGHKLLTVQEIDKEIIVTIEVCK